MSRKKSAFLQQTKQKYKTSRPYKLFGLVVKDKNYPNLHYKMSATASLNILCGVCCEYFKNNDNIYSTCKCGHAFHHKCLTRWMSNSNTCPQCRADCHPHMIHRLYLNFSESTPMDDMYVAVKDTYDWCPLDSSATDIASFGFKFCNDKNGDAIYAARVYYKNDLLPAYYVPKEKGVYFAWGCASHFQVNEIELLHIAGDKAEYKWIAAEDGDVPGNALAVGYTERGETLYFARTKYKRRMRYGKLHPSHRCCYVPYKEWEKNNKSYEVLVRLPTCT
ncbi:uncharacterized protein [Musca autumnalis]|uniref:uncharacterized protein n=1 Tax=Musca autumnalis TaxID=221902 RepID=UPI003CF5960D